MTNALFDNQIEGAAGLAIIVGAVVIVLGIMRQSSCASDFHTLPKRMTAKN